MALYIKTIWSTGDVITATKINNLETQYDNAVADALSFPPNNPYIVSKMK